MSASVLRCRERSRLGLMQWNTLAHVHQFGWDTHSDRKDDMYIFSHNEDEGDTALHVMKMRDRHQLQESHTGACDDDREVSAPYIGILPEESGKEDGSILDFSHERRRVIEEDIDAQIIAAL
jgi:hypothetical protein